MKNLLLLLTVGILAIGCKAQDELKMKSGLLEPLSIQTTETSVKIKKDTRKAQTTYIYGKPKDVEKKFVEYFEEKYACEIKNEKAGLTAANIIMSDVSLETVNFIGIVNEDERGTKLDVLVDLGTTYLNDSDNPGEIAKLKVVIKDFVSDFYVGWYDEVIEDDRKDFEKTQKEWEKSAKNGEKLQKDFDSKSEKMVKSEEDIVKSEKEIADLQNEIASLKADIENLKAEKTLLTDEIQKNKEETSKLKQATDKKAADLEKLKVNSDRLRTSN